MSLNISLRVLKNTTVPTWPTQSRVSGKRVKWCCQYMATRNSVITHHDDRLPLCSLRVETLRKNSADMATSVISQSAVLIKQTNQIRHCSGSKEWEKSSQKRSWVIHRTSCPLNVPNQGKFPGSFFRRRWQVVFISSYLHQSFSYPVWNSWMMFVQIIHKNQGANHSGMVTREFTEHRT